MNSAFRGADTASYKEYPDTDFLKELIGGLIAEAKEEGAQLILANLHFGIELDKLPSKQQIELAHHAVDCGADVVLGHHPHVLQSMEYYNGAYIAYSLGNFCFGGNTKPKNLDSVIWQQEFVFEGGEMTSQSVKIVPFLISSTTDQNDYCPVEAEGKDAKRIMDKLNDYSKEYGIHITEDGTVEVTE